MKILFIHCVNYREATPPEGIALLSAMLKEKKHEVRLFDTSFLKPKATKRKKEEGIDFLSRIQLHMPTAYSLEELTKNDKEIDIVGSLEELISDFQPHLIATSSMTTNFNASIRLINAIKEKVKVIFGGVHPTLLPDSVINKKQVDFVCVGEGEGALLDLCDNLEKGINVEGIANLYIKTKQKIIKNPLRLFVDLNNIPAPDLSIFDKRHFFRPFSGRVYKGMFLSTSRGCPRGCNYCVNNRFKELFKPCGKQYTRFQTPKIVARNIKLFKEKYGITWFKFSDDTFLMRPLAELEQLKGLIKPLKIMFGCMVDPTTITEKKVRLAKEMGCVSMTIGVETGNEVLRKKILGRNISTDNIINAVGIAKEHGIKVSTFNMIGLPGETKHNVFETLRLNQLLNVPDACLNIMYPFPGTEISSEYNIPQDNMLPMNEAYKFNRSKMSIDDLLFFQKSFNIFLALSERHWSNIYNSRNNDKLFEKYVRLAQEAISVKGRGSKDRDVNRAEFLN